MYVVKCETNNNESSKTHQNLDTIGKLTPSFLVLVILK